MIKLPTRQPQVQTGFVPQQYQNVQINPGAYDSGGSALAGMGKGLSSVSQDLDHIAQVLEHDEVKDKQTALDRYASQLMNGNGEDANTGYLGQTGKTALGNADAIKQQIEAERQRLRDSLSTGRAQRTFDSATGQMMSSTHSIIDAHRRQQIDVARLESSQAASDQALELYKVYADVPGFGKVVWDGGMAEETFRSGLSGNPNSAPTGSGETWSNRATNARVNYQLESGTPADAQQTLDRSKDSMTPAAVSRTQGTISIAQSTETVKTVLTDSNRALQDWPLYLGQSVSFSSTPEPINASEQIAPQAQGNYLGIPPLQEVYDHLEQNPQYQQLSEEQKKEARDQAAHNHAMATNKAREMSRVNLNKGLAVVNSGGSYYSIPPQVREHYSPRAAAAIKRQQAINTGQQEQETDFATIYYLSERTPTEFTRRILEEDAPFLSPVMGQVVSNIQRGLASGDPAEQMRAKAWLSTLGSIVREAGPNLHGNDLDALAMQAIRLVSDQVKSKGVPTSDQINQITGGIILGWREEVEGWKQKIAADPSTPPLSKPYAPPVVQLADLPVQLRASVVDDYKKEHKGPIDIIGLERFYQEHEVEYFQRFLRAPEPLVKKALERLRSFGHPVSLISVRDEVRRTTPGYFNLSGF